MSTVKDVLKSVRKGELDLLNTLTIVNINKNARIFLEHDPEVKSELEMMRDILEISNILYNNTDREMLPLEDGVYDLLVVKYNNLTGGKAPVGAPPIQFNQVYQSNLLEKHKAGDGPIQAVVRVKNKDDMLFFNALTANSKPIPSDFEHTVNNTLIGRRISNVAHTYPELVGTLDKCKFVLNAQAGERGLLTGDGADTVMVFERDFLGYYYGNGIDANELIAEIKYDGVSVEAEVDGDTIISARSRGDTNNNEATDLTPIFGGYVFKRATGYVPKGTIFGIKFEAIVTYYNIDQLKSRYGKSYANARNAVIGLTSSLDARKFRDFITLVPLACSPKTSLGIPNREVEIKFLNKYYSSGIDLRYEVLRGDYTTLLFLVKRFVEEAEYMRSFLPFMYDGVVVSYTDPAIVQRLGRFNSVNKYSIAIKFNALKKQTIFTGYTYSIGQNGLVTPKANFNPVEFMGGIHDNTTAHSLNRVNKLALRVGDIVDIELVNDVICYITKPQNIHNDNNLNPILQFPEMCPSCGESIYASDSGNSAYCINFECPERNVKRMSNMMKKLNIKDFSTQAVRLLGIYSLADLLDVTKNTACEIFGDVVGAKLMDRIDQIKFSNYPDYRIIGAIGFSSIAAEKWKRIMSNISLDTLINTPSNKLKGLLGCIKGIGPAAVETVLFERPMFKKDLIAIFNMPNVVHTFGDVSVKQSVRFTGIRDEALAKEFEKLGFDADGEKSVTKQTTILIVPYQGFHSSKMNKISPTCMVLPLELAWQHIKNGTIGTF